MIIKWLSCITGKCISAHDAVGFRLNYDNFFNLNTPAQSRSSFSWSGFGVTKDGGIYEKSLPVLRKDMRQRSRLPEETTFCQEQEQQRG